VRCMTALSGGVDSMTAARILMENYEVLGMTLKLHEEFSPEPVQALCEVLGIDLTVMREEEIFQKEVIAPFIRTYEEGRTPNPCIFCNRSVKFPLLLKIAQEKQCEKIATGHYARVEKDGERWILKKALCPEKDQSYVLSVLDQNTLSRLILPLGELSKEQVREKARDWKLKNADTPDSQDICFIPDGDYATYLCKNSGKKYPTGNFVDTEGKKLGTHKGIIHYTVGQRRGLGLPLGYHAYVVSKDAATNRIVVGREEDLYTQRVTLKKGNLIPFDRIEGSLRCKARARYSARECDATLHQLAEDQLLLEYDQPQRAVTPGQTAVFYIDDIVVGEGEIIRAE